MTSEVFRFFRSFPVFADFSMRLLKSIDLWPGILKSNHGSSSEDKIGWTLFCSPFVLKVYGSRKEMCAFRWALITLSQPKKMFVCWISASNLKVPCGELVKWLSRWTPGPGVLSAGVRSLESERKIFMGCPSVSHPHEGDPKSAVLSLNYGGLLCAA